MIWLTDDRDWQYNLKNALRVWFALLGRLVKRCETCNIYQMYQFFRDPLKWRHNERHGVPNHQHIDCLLNHLFRCRSMKTPKLRVTGLCEGNPPVTVGFPSQRAGNAENASIWWRHHAVDSIENASWFVWFVCSSSSVLLRWLWCKYAN